MPKAVDFSVQPRKSYLVATLKMISFPKNHKETTILKIIQILVFLNVKKTMLIGCTGEYEKNSGAKIPAIYLGFMSRDLPQ